MTDIYFTIERMGHNVKWSDDIVLIDITEQHDEGERNDLKERLISEQVRRQQQELHLLFLLRPAAQQLLLFLGGKRTQLRVRKHLFQPFQLPSRRFPARIGICQRRQLLQFLLAAAEKGRVLPDFRFLQAGAKLFRLSADLSDSFKIHAVILPVFPVRRRPGK